MKPDAFDNLEHAVEQQMALLRGLLEPTPSAGWLDGVRQRVAGEARRAATRRRRLRRVRGVAGIAAALLLAVGWSTYTGSRNASAAVPPEDALNEWASAWEESNTRVLGLLEGGWLVADFGSDWDGEASLDDVFESLDESLGCFAEL